jgi:hypothetical protein
MERFNIFQLVHKGLRAALYQTALQLQQTDFTAEEETEEVLNRVKEIIMLFNGHAQNENTYIFPAAEEFEPSVVTAFRDEHMEDMRLGQQLQNGIDKVTASKGMLAHIVSGRELTEAFIEFMVFNLKHMAKEEDIINKVLWRYYSDDDIRLIAMRITQHTPPWIQEFYATWMLRGINDAEAVSWMKAIERGMPPVVFETILQKAEQELPGHRFNNVTTSLSEGQLID